MGINPKCIDNYAVLECKNLTKLHIFAAKHKVNTYSAKLFPSDDCASIWSWPPVKSWRHVKPKNWLADNSVICMLSLRCLLFIVLRAMFIIFGLKSIIKQLLDLFLVFSLEILNKTIIGWVYCDMPNYQCLGKSYPPSPWARLITLTSALIILYITINLIQ